MWHRRGTFSVMHRRLWIPLVAVAVLCSGAGAWTWLQRDAALFDRSDGTVIGSHGTRLATTLLVPSGADVDHPAPAVLLAHGLGATRADVRDMARTLARAGYVVRTWDARGTGDSGGQVGIAGADGEVQDMSYLLDDLARRDDVARDAPGDPRVAVIGVSHGGGTALLAAERDHRIDALVPIFAWSDLQEALEPNAAQPIGGNPYGRGDAGVLKIRWASELFAAGAGNERRATPCGTIEAELCELWTDSAEQGSFTATARKALTVRSADADLAKLTAPTLLVQGQFDSLFEFDQAERVQRALTKAHTPVRVEWLRAGHDLDIDLRGRQHLEQAVLRWLNRHVARDRDVEVGPNFTIQLGAGRGYAHAPSIDASAKTRRFVLRPVQHRDKQGRTRLAAPPAGLPADTTTLPGLGDVTGIGDLAPPPGQRARFESSVSTTGLEIIGTPTVRLGITGTAREAIMFVRLVDIASDGRRLIPRGLVAPIRVRDVPPIDASTSRGVLVTFPAIAWRLAPGHRFAVEIATTDAGYIANPRAGIFGVELIGDGILKLPIADAPQRSDDTFDAGVGKHAMFGVAGALVLLALAIAFVLDRIVTGRAARVQEPRHHNDPVVARGLGKRFPEGIRAVDDASFNVFPGTIVGLVGPNGAGKTTVLRMLLGLVHPNEGQAFVFGQRVRPGAPSLARVGALIEGPGLIPDRTGRAHLERHWSVTGRPRSEAGIDAALAEVEMTRDSARLVRTYSHGMRQRLGIAQALLGRPDLVVLDEPTNGLDPAQIRHLRDVIRGIAADGRTVLVSSHLLAELEQVCTHVVLMAEGRVLATGTLDEVRGAHATLEASFLAHLIEGAGDVG